METQRAWPERPHPTAGCSGCWGGDTQSQKTPRVTQPHSSRNQGCWSQSSQRHRPGTAGDRGDPGRDAVSPCRAAERCPPLTTQLSVAPLRSLHLVLLRHRPPERQLCPSRVPRPQNTETDAPQAAPVGSWGSGTTADPTAHSFTPKTITGRNHPSCPCWVTALMSPGSKPHSKPCRPRSLSVSSFRWLPAARFVSCPSVPLLAPGAAGQGDTEPTAPVPAPKPRCWALGSRNLAPDTGEGAEGSGLEQSPPRCPKSGCMSPSSSPRAHPAPETCVRGRIWGTALLGGPDGAPLLHPGTATPVSAPRWARCLPPAGHRAALGERRAGHPNPPPASPRRTRPQSGTANARHAPHPLPPKPIPEPSDPRDSPKLFPTLLPQPRSPHSGVGGGRAEPPDPGLTESWRVPMARPRWRRLPARLREGAAGPPGPGPGPG